MREAGEALHKGGSGQLAQWDVASGDLHGSHRFTGGLRESAATLNWCFAVFGQNELVRLAMMNWCINAPDSGAPAI